MNRGPSLLIALSLLAGLILAARQAAAQTAVTGPPDRRFGVIESHVAPDKATNLGAAWTRLIFHWAQVQAKGPGSWDPPVDDEVIEAELAAGREIVGLLIGIPDWARDEDQLPQGLWLPADDPDNRWAAFVRQAVGRYRGRIDHWIIWNEPDIPAAELAHTWDGDVADFAQLQRGAYLAARSANPEAIIHLAATTFWADYQANREPYLARLLDEITADPRAASHHYYFDVATAHLYFQPNQIYELLGLFTGIMRDRGLDHPIWLVETNAPPEDDPSWPLTAPHLKVNQREQAAFMPQALAAALAAGAERLAVYKLQDTPSDRLANPEPFGLVRENGTVRPAFETYRIAIRQLAGVFRAEMERWNEVGQIRLDHVGQTTTVLFARLPQSQVARVPATGDTAQLIDMWGAARTITPTLGAYTVHLSPARCSQSIGDYCMIGGPTYYLVQEAGIDPPTPTPTPTATPTPAATPTPEPTAIHTPTLGPTTASAPAATAPFIASTRALENDPPAAAAQQDAPTLPDGRPLLAPALLAAAVLLALLTAVIHRWARRGRT
jgi:hypothetical protein